VGLLCLLSLLGVSDFSVRAADDKEAVSRLDAVVARAVDQGYADLDALCQAMLDTQRANTLLVPPGMDYCEFPLGVKVFSPKGFPKDFLAGLVASDLDGATVYPVRVTETEDGTLELRNAKDEVFYKIPAPGDYTLLWLVLARYADFWSKPAAEREELAYLYDPTRAGIAVNLIESADLYTLLETQTQAAASLDFEMDLFRGLDDGSQVDDLMITAIEPSNTTRITISYPATFVHTNIDVFACDGGQALSNGWWTVAGQTNRAGVTTNHVHFLDATAGSAATRFYTCANGDVAGGTNACANDLDGDQLSNLRERWVSHTSAYTNNTDGDAYGDYTEVMTYRTDPNSNDVTHPAVAIALPVNATLKEVLP